MALPLIGAPVPAMTALADFVRARLVEVGDTLAPLWRGETRPDAAVLGAARQFATVVVGAAAPFAPTPYARARLIRQMHASGLLDADQARRAVAVLEAGDPVGSTDGVPRA